MTTGLIVTIVVIVVVVALALIAYLTLGHDLGRYRRIKRM